jgi:hypothetical protein
MTDRSERKAVATFQFWWRILAALAGVFLVFVISVGLGFQDELTREGKVVLLAITAMLFGACVGAAEILSRYRDEPFLVITTTPAAGYVILNGLISFASFGLLLRYGTKLFSPVSDDLVLSAIAAGFGGMMIARSKLFTYQGEGGTEYSFGPAIVLDSFLKTLDRKIDRLRSAERQKRVFERIQKLQLDQNSFEFALDYLQVSLQSYQNLDQTEKGGFAKELEGYRDLDEWPLLLRMLAVGFALLNICGEENFDQVIGDLVNALDVRKDTAAPPPPST